ncbi:MAG: YqgE/AlgH family protein [Hyphomonadaceae bacterium]|nr:YqgE/AlgH family protein [Hyphomonadaceae bacterium]
MSEDTLTGKLLVAMPGMSDPRFDKSVIMMCAHDSEHAMGVVINKPKEDLTLWEVLDHLGLKASDEASARLVLDGGPVRPDRGYVLHSEDFAAGEATQDVAPGIRLTATRDVLEAVAGDQAPTNFVLALGCAGWGAGQLEDELRHNAWLVVDFDDAIVFDRALDDKWERAIKSLGIELSQLTEAAGNA